MYPISNLNLYPYVRLLLPFAGGIGAHGWLASEAGRGVVPVVATALLTCICWTAFWAKPLTFRHRWTAGVLFFVFWAVAGWWAADEACRRTEWVDAPVPSVYRGRLLASPQQKEHRVLLPLQLVERRDSLGRSWPVDRCVWLYVPSDTVARSVGLSDEVWFRALVRRPVSDGNPNAFDYAAYLQSRGVSGVAYADSGCWHRSVGHAPFSLRRWALRLRDVALRRYRTCGFEGEVYAVLAALTTGHRTELADDIRQAYASAGISHVLALSGLHLGVVCALLGFLLRLLPRQYFPVWLQQLVLLAATWLFALFTGLSASVVRAAVMLSFFIVARMWGRDYVGLNVWAMAAFYMLCCNPLWLHDVGFQLSFAAVAGILVLYPWLRDHFRVQNRWVSWAWQLTLVSVSAQAGCFPLLMHHFGRFPVFGLLVNVPAVWLVTVLLWGVAAWWALCWLPPVQAWLTPVLDGMVRLQNGMARMVEQFSQGMESAYVFDWTAVGVCYAAGGVLLLHVLGWCRVRWWGWVLVAGGLTGFFHFSWQAMRITEPTVVVYNSSRLLVHYVTEGGRAYVQADSLCDEREYRWVASGFERAHRLEQPCWLPDVYADGVLQKRGGIVRFRGLTLCVVDDGRWRGLQAGSPLRVDWLVLAGGFRGRVEDLRSVFAVGRVVLHRSLGTRRQQRLMEECRTLGMECTLLSEHGALLIRPGETPP